MTDRKARRVLIKKMYAANPMHKRLFWVRQRLGLKGTEVSSATGIPVTNYFDRENGVRTSLYEEILILAIFFQSGWVKKYGPSKMFPYWHGEMVSKITPMWLFFGKDTSLENAKEMLTRVKEDFNAREMELIERQNDLENQIEMFKGEKV